MTLTDWAVLILSAAMTMQCVAVIIFNRIVNRLSDHLFQLSDQLYRLEEKVWLLETKRASDDRSEGKIRAGPGRQDQTDAARPRF